MAKIYGRPESEKEILFQCDSSIRNFEDIDKTHKDIIDRLKNERKKFFEDLPYRIREEKMILNELKRKGDVDIKKRDGEIKLINNRIEYNKTKLELLAFILFDYFELLIERYILKPYEINKIEREQRKQQKNIEELVNNPEDIFDKNQKNLKYEIAKLERLKKNPHYPGAYGELEVLKELSKLNDEYHVLCGVNIKLDKYYSYRGKEFNLKSAQMDFVVICYKGIFLIEVKNWSSSYVHEKTGLSPHEQVDRAGRVLYKFLKKRLPRDVDINRRITKILIPIQNNIRYDADYKSIIIKPITEVNKFIIGKKGVLNDYDIERIIEHLEPYITY